MSFFAPKSGKNRLYFKPLVVERVEKVPFPHPTMRGEAKFSAATSQEWKQIMLMTSRLQHFQKLKEERRSIPSYFTIQPPEPLKVNVP